MLDGDCLTFVEVRFRGNNPRVSAVLTVDGRKQDKLAAAAAMFLSRHRAFRHHACRFDVVGVEHTQDGKVAVDWVRDAFRPDA